MSTSNLFWFHCGRCGSLFQSPAGDLENRLCPACGTDPSLGLIEAPQGAAKPGDGTTAPPAGGAGHPERSGKHGGKKHSGRFLMWKLFGGWLLVLVLIVAAARHLWPGEETDNKPFTSATQSNSTSTESNEDFALLNASLIKCSQTLSSLLVAGTPETRNQFVLSPVSTAARMARFYSLSPLTTVDPGTLTLTANSILVLPTGRAIETSWGSEDGKIFDVVFSEENGEWRIDWDHFARYGDYPWSLFLAGSGPPEGEFRLLARERLADAHKKDDSISIVLYAPRFAHPRETGFQSPEFLVPRNTLDGRLLDAAFKLARSGGQVFGSKLPNLNPEDMIRVRVKVRRIEVDRERKFELAAVVACHWYAVDDPGVVPGPVPETKTGDGSNAPPADAKPAESLPRLPNLKKDGK